MFHRASLNPQQLVDPFGRSTHRVSQLHCKSSVTFEVALTLFWQTTKRGRERGRGREGESDRWRGFYFHVGSRRRATEMWELVPPPSTPHQPSGPSKLRLWPRLLLFCLHIVHIKEVGRLENKLDEKKNNKKKRKSSVAPGPGDKG